MRRSAAATAALLALALTPGSAGAEIIEVGATPGVEATPACPGSPCLAVSRTTGYQAKVGEDRGLMEVTRKGRIVAWTIALSEPNAAQIKFFNRELGGAAQAGLAVLKPGKRLAQGHVVKAAGPLVALDPYFGSVAQFPLATSIPVVPGDLIALTVPTWAPALQVGLTGDTSWRASRPKDKCKDNKTQTAQMNVRDKAVYYCLYRTARLLYSATLVTTPKQVNRDKSDKSDRDSRR